MTEYIAVNSNNLITAFVWSGLLDRAKCGELLEIIKQCSVEIASIEVLQEIRKDIAEYKDDKIIHAEKNEMIDIVLEIIDSHISNIGANNHE